IELICDRAVFLRDGVFVRDIDLTDASGQETTILTFNKNDINIAKSIIENSYNIIKNEDNYIVVNRLDNYQEILKVLSTS
ncbi:antibiotic ABC transporter ATP-binding protein, partial [Staphylococcus epidermidis]